MSSCQKSGTFAQTGSSQGSSNAGKQTKDSSKAALSKTHSKSLSPSNKQKKVYPKRERNSVPVYHHTMKVHKSPHNSRIRGNSVKKSLSKTTLAISSETSPSSALRKDKNSKAMKTAKRNKALKTSKDSKVKKKSSSTSQTKGSKVSKSKSKALVPLVSSPLGVSSPLFVSSSLGVPSTFGMSMPSYTPPSGILGTAGSNNNYNLWSDKVVD